MSAWKLGRLLGIDVKLHWSFLLLLAWVGYEHYLQGQTPGEVAVGVLFVVCLFGCVLLHEYGHALTARRFGVQTRDITMLPIGGVARLTSIPREPRQEFLIAVAGPAVNVAIGAAIAALLLANGGVESLLPMETTVDGLVEGEVSRKDFIVKDLGDFLRSVLYANGMLVAFNMIPAFPMDGGRVLRAGLAMVTDYRRATRWAAAVGKAVCVGFVYLYFFHGAPWTLLLIALFVWYGAGTEAREVHVRELLGGADVGRVMMTDFQTVHPDDTLERVATLLLSGSQQEFPVVAGAGGLPVGMLTRKGLVKAAQSEGFAARVGDVMSAAGEPLPPTAPAVAAYRRMRRDSVSSLPVADGPILVGLVTQENLREYLMLREAFEGRDGGSMPMPGSELVV